MSGRTVAVRALAIVPARIGSVRLPRKMLRRDTGRYLFEHTVRNAERACSLARVVLAADAEELLAAAAEVGIEALATSPRHPSGTDRVHEAARILRERDGVEPDVVLNVQGDEPELEPEDLDRLVAAFADPAVALASLWAPLGTREEALDPTVVKVVVDRAGDALYFSRSPVPSLEHPARPVRSEVPALRRHIGVYAFRPEALEAFCALPRGELEAAESLEQLRWLEAGRKIRMVRASRTTAGIDTEEQYAAFAARVREGAARAGAGAGNGAGTR